MSRKKKEFHRVLLGRTKTNLMSWLMRTNHNISCNLKMVPHISFQKQIEFQEEMEQHVFKSITLCLFTRFICFWCLYSSASSHALALFIKVKPLHLHCCCWCCSPLPLYSLKASMFIFPSSTPRATISLLLLLASSRRSRRQKRSRAVRSCCINRSWRQKLLTTKWM